MRVSIDLSDAELVWVDRAVENGLFEDRDAAIRSVRAGSPEGLDDVAIAEAYRRGYAWHPVREEHSEAGLTFLSDALRTERQDS